MIVMQNSAVTRRRRPTRNKSAATQQTAVHVTFTLSPFLPTVSTRSVIISFAARQKGLDPRAPALIYNHRGGAKSPPASLQDVKHKSDPEKARARARLDESVGVRLGGEARGYGPTGRNRCVLFNVAEHACMLTN